MISPKRQSDAIYVVDSQPSDYREAELTAKPEGVSWTFLKNGREALRQAAQPAPRMWVVNSRLNDMEGTELCTMLRDRGVMEPIVLVTDRYDAQEEIRARSTGVACYFTKPVPGDWLIKIGHGED